jgi:hypothetical protein
MGEGPETADGRRGSLTVVDRANTSPDLEGFEGCLNGSRTMKGEAMAQYLAAALLAGLCGSCATHDVPGGPWSLSIVNRLNPEIYVDRLRTLDDCQRAGAEWVADWPLDYVMECRLNCKPATKEHPPVCEEIEPVG